MLKLFELLLLLIKVNYLYISRKQITFVKVLLNSN